MRKQIISCLGVLAFTTPALAQSTASTESTSAASRPMGTYTPGQAGVEGTDSGAYLQRGSAVRQTPGSDRRISTDFRMNRGGGPGAASAATRTDGVSNDYGYRPWSREAPRVSNGALLSDNQTRRPGAANYTGASRARPVEDASQHTISGASGVSMVGDNFGSNTASPTRGTIPVRAPSSNEAAPPPPTARGGGPVSSNHVVLPSGETALLARSAPLHWNPGAAHASRGANLERDAFKSPLSTADIRSLPFAGDGTSRSGEGLLGMEPTVRSSALLDTAETVTASPAQIRLNTSYPAPTRALGGGPR